jgi:hypothetical protein
MASGRGGSAVWATILRSRIQRRGSWNSMTKLDINVQIRYSRRPGGISLISSK